MEKIQNLIGKAPIEKFGIPGPEPSCKSPNTTDDNLNIRFLHQKWLAGSVIKQVFLPWPKTQQTCIHTTRKMTTKLLHSHANV